MKKITFVFLLFFCSFIARAQQHKAVEGRVITEQGETLPGVTIHVKGGETNKYTTTNFDGEFKLDMPNTEELYALDVSFSGFQTVSYGPFEASDTLSPITITLKEESTQLDEVVVTGQGLSINKRRLSTDIMSIKGDELDKLPSSRVDQMLQSQLPNAQIKLTGGQAGATSIIRSRGVNSAFINSTPIIYVDGIRMDNLNTSAAIGGGSTQGASISSIADIPMDNIERIEYINGGAATTIFGSDAANGVIQIFTRKGQAGKTNITFEAQLGLEKGTKDFLHFERTADLLFQDGFYQKYSVSVNGGNDKLGYSISGNYFNTNGTQIHNQNSNQKYDIATGFRASLAKGLTYESSFSYVNNQYHRNRNGNQGGYTGLWFAESGASSITGPTFNNKLDELTGEEFSIMKEWVSEAERLQDNKINVNRFITSQTIKYRPLYNLNIKVSGGVDYRVLDDKTIHTNKYIAHTTNAPSIDKGSITAFERRYLGYTLETNAQHQADAGDFSFVTTIGGQLFSTEDHQVSYKGENLRDGSKIISTAAVRTANEAFFESVNYGAYILENIGYKNKYFVDLGIRGDGNPAFGSSIGIQYYPKVGFSWIISSESWGSGNIVSNMKLRANYGIAGNLPPTWANEKTINFSGFLGDQGAYFGQPGNDDLKPEKSHTYEAAMDVGLFDNRLMLTAGYYRTITKDALFSVPALPSSGEMQNQLRNVGEILNEGFEVSTVVEAIKTKNVSLRINASLNTLHNEVLSSNGVPPFNINGFSSRTLQTVVEEGQPIGFLRATYGIFDENGVLSEVLNQQNLGSTIPDLFGKIGLNFSWQSLNIYANADYQMGAYVNDWDSQFRFNYGVGNEGIPQAEIDAHGRTNWLNFTNMFVKKADFLKVRTIGASYTLNSPVKGIRQLILGFQVTNPLNFTSCDFDPEATISGAAQGQGSATTGGIKYATYSSPRQFIASLRFNF
ncbi:MAG: TonB-dependent receptor [Prevotellaceae bacterium]|jgi:outer membrane receptor protein involved in Fe transport|nr:TonB-dependent receptor [Prevotellaceae bacterium]